MDNTAVSCPVCTLYLRPGITLKNHLSSHPKQKVIEALVRLSQTGDVVVDKAGPSTEDPTPPWTPPSQNNMVMPPGSHVFIYQQSMTSSTPPQQYVIPTILNPQMMPYIYQQQVIMSGGFPNPVRPLALPIEAPEGERRVEEITELEEVEEEEENKEDGDLDKACQALLPEGEGTKDDFYFEGEGFYEAPPPVYPLPNNEQIDFVDMVVMNDFGSQVISQVENFEGSGPERGVLMTIGGMGETSRESMSRESENLNIRADEKMPPRGELSGQESMASSDIGWNRTPYESTSTSYDLVARENWEGSDSSDVDVPSVKPIMDEEEKKDSIKTKLGEIGKKPVKKIIVKFKEDKTENVFTNKLKIEEKATDEIVEEPKTDENPEVKAVCSICDAVLSSTKALREHKMTVHNISAQTRHKCPTCDQQFPNDYKFSEHLRVHPLECKICGRLFYRRQNIQLHMRRHLGIKPYKCDICEKSFLTKQKLDEHRNIHTGDAPIKCPLCDETFRRHSNLVQHRNRHHLNIKKKVKDYICFCKEVFHSKKKLAWHKEIHDAKPKSCTHCNEKFIHTASLTRHMRRAHNDRFLPNGNKNAENVECPICKGVYLKSSLEVHIRNHSGQRPYACLICNKDFTTKWNLKLHKWTHASRVSKPFKCDQCKGAFIRESDYIAHMNSHKSIRPYTCNHCGAQFIRKYNCQRHVKEHENEKMFNCKVCGKTFHRSYYLKDHMRIHSGVRPFSCHICGKTSTTKSNHNKHVQIHHAREPISTEN